MARSSSEHPEAYPANGRLPHRRRRAARSDRVAGTDRPAGAPRCIGAGVRDRLFERRQPDSRALGAARGRAGDSRGTRCECGRAAPDAAGGEPGAVRCRRDSRRRHRAADGGHSGALRGAFLGARAGPHGRCEPALGRRRPGARRRRRCWRSCRGLPSAEASQRARPVERQRPHHVGHESPAANLRGDPDRRVVRAPCRRRDAVERRSWRCSRRRPASRCTTCSR